MCKQRGKRNAVSSECRSLYMCIPFCVCACVHACAVHLISLPNKVYYITWDSDEKFKLIHINESVAAPQNRNTTGWFLSDSQTTDSSNTAVCTNRSSVLSLAILAISSHFLLCSSSCSLVDSLLNIVTTMTHKQAFWLY